jgi:hypothetical protein
VPVAEGALVSGPVPAAVRTTSGTDWTAAAAGLVALALTGWTVTRTRGARARD